MEDVTTGTIDLLEARLRRLEYAVKGHLDSVDSSASKSALERLAKLDSTLQRLCSQSRVVRELLELQARCPEIFEDSDQAMISSDVPAMLSTVLASASSYHLTASQLSSIHDLPLPPADASRQLIELEPRAIQLATTQQSQKREIASLRQQTAELLQRWYSVNVLYSGEYWAEVDSRVDDMEQQIRRREFLKEVEG